MARRQYGTGSLRLRGRSWQARYYHHGESVVEYLKPDPKTGAALTRQQAEKVLREKLRTVGTPAFVPPDAQRVLFIDLADLVRRDYARKGNRSTARLEDALGHLADVFGRDRALDITAERVDAYVDARRAEGAANATINRELATLRRGFRLAVHRRRLPMAPAIQLLDESGNVRDGFVEPADFDVILAGLRDAGDPDVADVAEWAYLTLMRRENALGLEWTWLTVAVEGGQVTGGSVRLPGTVTKNKKPLALPLTGRLLDVIRRRWALRIPACPYVFHRHGRRVVRFDTAWEAARTAAGHAGLHFHDLRRSGARNLRRAGVAETVIMRMGGWKTRATFIRYDVTSDADLIDAADAYNAFLDQNATAGRKVVPLPQRVRA